MVEIEDVTKRFGRTVAVAGASLAVEKGDFLTILGPSGCGKTTLLRMVAGFIRPDRGAIRIAGSDVAQVPPYRRSIGMVFQRLALFPHMTAAENVAYPLKRRRFPAVEIAGRVARFLDLVRLSGLGERRPHELSGGQQQRVAIARALSFGPDLLLLDEPLSALDRKLREDMQLEFRRIQQDLGVTTINVTHDQREALVMSDRIVVMDGGRVQQAGSPEAVYRAPANRFVASFIGVASTFSGTVVAHGDGVAEVAAYDARLMARLADPVPPGAPVELSVRAERVRLGAAEGLANRLEGTLAQTIFEGDRMVHAVQVPALGGATILVYDSDPAAATPPEGAPVILAFAAADLFAFPAPPAENEQEPTP